jgi:cobalt/nickel transport system permease protein
MKDLTFVENSSSRSTLSELDPRTKLVACFILVTCCVTADNMSIRLFGSYLVLLSLITVFGKLSLKTMLCKTLVILPFIGVVIISLFLLSGLNSLSSTVGTILRIVVSILSIIILTISTPFEKIINGLGQLKVPSIFLQLLSFTYRYLFIMFENISRKYKAIKSRGFQNRGIWQATTIGKLIAVMMIRGFDRGERIHLAMISRGGDQGFKSYRWTEIPLNEIIFLSIFAILIISMRIFLI